MAEVDNEQRQPLSTAEKLEIFEESLRRQRLREASRPKPEPATDRGWTREELYGDRGRPR